MSALGRIARRGERGVAIVELAMVLPLLFLLVMGTFDLGRAVYIRNALANAARDGARFATVDPRNTNCIQSVAARNSSLAGLSTASVSISTPGSVAIGQPVTVSVQSTYQPVTALIAGAIGVNSVTLQSSATMQIRNVPSSSLACP